MKKTLQILRRPLVTEKGTMLKEKGNKVIFEVAQDANKIEIAQAVEKIFKVDVVKVNTVHVRGKRRRMGRMPEGRTPDWKKAIVTVKPGQTITMFEGL